MIPVCVTVAPVVAVGAARRRREEEEAERQRLAELEEARKQEEVRERAARVIRLAEVLAKTVALVALANIGIRLAVKDRRQK